MEGVALASRCRFYYPAVAPNRDVSSPFFGTLRNPGFLYGFFLLGYPPSSRSRCDKKVAKSQSGNVRHDDGEPHFAVSISVAVGLVRSVSTVVFEEGIFISFPIP